MTVEIARRSDITLDAVRRVAWQREPVGISPVAMTRMRRARSRFEGLIARPDVVIYGVTSGYGQNASKRLSAEERIRHARTPPSGAAASWGDPFPDRVVRAIVLARLANFVEGHAAISPGVAVAVADMLAGGSLPEVPGRGQGGAGEILALSHLFWTLASTTEVAEKDVLSLINGSPVASALVADAALAARRRLDVAADVFALAAEGFATPLTHFAPEIDGLWGNPHDAWALAALRNRMGDAGEGRRPYQAPVSFRILPRILGQLHRACAIAEEVAGESLASVTDNPVYLFPVDDEDDLGRAVSTGGFHNPHAVMAMDMLAAAYANLCLIAGRMAAKLLDGAVSLLPPQLEAGPQRSYLGCLPMAITGYEEEARLCAQPTLLPGSESGGFAQNDVASPSPLAWTKQERAALMLEASLAALAPIGLRALRVTGREVPSSLSSLVEAVGRLVPDDGLGVRFGPPTHELAAHLRQAVYAAEGTSSPPAW